MEGRKWCWKKHPCNTVMGRSSRGVAEMPLGPADLAHDAASLCAQELETLRDLHQSARNHMSHHPLHSLKNIFSFYT